MTRMGKDGEDTRAVCICVTLCEICQLCDWSCEVGFMWPLVSRVRARVWAQMTLRCVCYPPSGPSSGAQRDRHIQWWMCACMYTHRGTKSSFHRHKSLPSPSPHTLHTKIYSVQTHLERICIQISSLLYHVQWPSPLQGASGNGCRGTVLIISWPVGATILCVPVNLFYSPVQNQRVQNAYSWSP